MVYSNQKYNNSQAGQGYGGKKDGGNAYNKRQYRERDAYYPKKPVKSFQDLEVYQKALESNVFVVKEIAEKYGKKLESKKGSARKITDVKKGHGAKDKGKCFQQTAISAAGSSAEELNPKVLIINGLIICSSKIPHLIAESHSQRFGSGTKCLDVLDEVMLQCNKAVVYLEQARDICETEIEWEKFDEQIKKYFYIRRKVLNLQRVWRKYIEHSAAEYPAADVAFR